MLEIRERLTGWPFIAVRPLVKRKVFCLVEDKISNGSGNLWLFQQKGLHFSIKDYKMRLSRCIIKADKMNRFNVHTSWGRKSLAQVPNTQ